MVKKISTTLLVLFVIGLAMNFTFKNGGDKRNVLAPNIAISGDETPVIQNRPVIQFDENNFEPEYYSDSVTTLYKIRTGPETIYDLQSNGVNQQLWQDPNDDNVLHATFTVNLTPGWPATDRRCYYMISTDKGVTWDNYGPNPTTGSNGFCVCSGLSDGRAVLGGHTDNGSTPVRFQIFVDAAPGAGNFTRLDPGTNPFNSLQNIWGRIMPTSNVSNPIKIVFAASINTPGADSMVSFNRALSLTTSSFSGYVRMPDINNAETYSFARASDGRIGCAYVVNDFINTAGLGDVHYIVSTDNGVTWSAPVTAWDAPPYLDGVFGCLRGVTLTYVGTTPKVAFELLGQNATGYYPNGRAAIGFWAPNVNSGNGFVLPFDSTWMQNGNGGATDVYTSICRPSISKSKNEQLLMMTFMVSRADTDAIGSHFYDVYLSWSTNGGANWRFPPTKITNTSGPVRDNRFACMSPTNDQNVNGTTFYANMTFQLDSVPGSVTQTPAAAESLAKQWYARATLTGIVIGIHNISSEVPNSFSLQQNYPNPFNPTTKIRFAVPKETDITLEVYDITGKLIATLAKNEKVSAGIKEVDFNASGLASGIYFYTIKAGDFRDTKKMVLVK